MHTNKAVLKQIFYATSYCSKDIGNYTILVTCPPFKRFSLKIFYLRSHTSSKATYSVFFAM